MVWLSCHCKHLQRKFQWKSLVFLSSLLLSFHFYSNIHEAEQSTITKVRKNTIYATISPTFFLKTLLSISALKSPRLWMWYANLLLYIYLQHLESFQDSLPWLIFSMLLSQERTCKVSYSCIPETFAMVTCWPRSTKWRNRQSRKSRDSTASEGAGQGRQPEIFLITSCIHKTCNTSYNIKKFWFFIKKSFIWIIMKLNNWSIKISGIY